MTGFPVFALLVASAAVVAQDCEDIGGQCLDWEDYICHAGWETGLCPGDENIRCCLSCDTECQDNEEEWSQEDGECEAMGGECYDNTNYCDGIYETGVCGGPDDRQCCRPLSDDDCPTLITREEWGARDPSCSPTYMGDGVPYYFTHHSEGSDCYSVAECSEVLQAIQDYHMFTNGWCDIGYSFMIGGDGNVYEGRSWNAVGAHTYGFNDVGYGTCFLGDFMDELPTADAVNAGLAQQNCAQSLGKITSDYEMYGHRQTSNTDCPGDVLYQSIQTWPHWTPGCIEYYGDGCGDI